MDGARKGDQPAEAGEGKKGGQLNIKADPLDAEDFKRVCGKLSLAQPDGFRLVMEAAKELSPDEGGDPALAASMAACQSFFGVIDALKGGHALKAKEAAHDIQEAAAAIAREKADFDSRIARLKESLASKAAMADDLESGAMEREKELDEARKRIAFLEAAHEDTRRRNASLEALGADLEKFREQSKSAAKSLKASERELRKEIESLSAKIESAERDALSAESSHSESSSQIESLSKKIVECKKKLAEKAEAMDALLDTPIT
jgi:peptidoglycan hydrolase CwlO-like protein